jgi:hypothetical protein
VNFKTKTQMSIDIAKQQNMKEMFLEYSMTKHTEQLDKQNSELGNKNLMELNDIKENSEQNKSLESNVQCLELGLHNHGNESGRCLVVQFAFLDA